MVHSILNEDDKLRWQFFIAGIGIGTGITVILVSLALIVSSGI